MALAITLGVITGLIEGGVHIGLQKLHVLENNWYPIVWIAAVFNGVLLAVIAAVCSAVLGRLPARPVFRIAAIFAIVLAAVLPVLALGLRSTSVNTPS